MQSELDNDGFHFTHRQEDAGRELQPGRMQKRSGMKVTPIKEKDAEKRGRKASKETRQLQLIEATIDSLAKRGYSETTMADVADGAGPPRFPVERPERSDLLPERPGIGVLRGEAIDKRVLG